MGKVDSLAEKIITHDAQHQFRDKRTQINSMYTNASITLLNTVHP